MSSPPSIWEGRVMKELKALRGNSLSSSSSPSPPTSDEPTLPSSDLPPSPTPNKNTKPFLPPFITIHDVTNNNAQQTCALTFKIQASPDAEIYIEADLSSSLTENENGDAKNENELNYPFAPPRFTLLTSSPLLVGIASGTRINLSFEWTPSLQLHDGVVDIGVRIKEAVVSGGGFSNSGFEDGVGIEASPDAADVPASPVTAPLMTSEEAGLMANHEYKINDTLDLPNWPIPIYDCKVVRKPSFITALTAAAAAAAIPSLPPSPSTASTSTSTTAPPSKLTTSFLTTSTFFKNTFTSISTASRSVLEETFMAITPTQIIEIKANKFTLGVGTISLVLPIARLSKIKFRRDESISFYFKEDAVDPLVYICVASAEVVNSVQTYMSKIHGVKGKHTNSYMSRAIEDAVDIITLINVKERHLEAHPTVAMVNEIMDLYRQSAERFAEAGDGRHEEVMVQMKRFLKKPVVVGLLDGSYVERKAGETDDFFHEEESESERESEDIGRSEDEDDEEEKRALRIQLEKEAFELDALEAESKAAARAQAIAKKEEGAELARRLKLKEKEEEEEENRKNIRASPHPLGEVLNRSVDLTAEGSDDDYENSSPSKRKESAEYREAMAAVEEIETEIRASSNAYSDRDDDTSPATNTEGGDENEEKDDTFMELEGMLATAEEELNGLVVEE